MSRSAALKERIDAFPTHAVLTGVWAALILPTLIWWKDSILWVSLMSIYAICISHWTAHEAWGAKRAAKRANEGEPKT